MFNDKLTIQDGHKILDLLDGLQQQINILEEMIKTTNQRIDFIANDLIRKSA